jgi:UDP-N-acetylglucosamine--N-acetylmuramyl-(pentapeptide) pyrophosphoryl-undecaprenol N-acetylglucosamine transferase
MPLQHLIFSGGGTGGHLFPGLAVAAELRRRDPRLHITFAGSGRELERRHVEAAGFDYLPIECRPWPRRPWRLPGFALGHLASIRAATRYLNRRGADAVIGLGGYASVPMARAALALDVPLVLLEQNAVAGRANRWLAARAQCVCTSFDETRHSLPAAAHALLTGNPVRPAFLDRGRPQREKLLLVLGGSGGAADLNEHSPLALTSCRDLLTGWQIIHQSGTTSAAATQAWYRRLGMEVEVSPFLDDLPELLSRAELVICRGGGTTLAELAATGVPAIVCPFARAANNHQRRNAEVYYSADACLMVDGRDPKRPLSVQLAAALSQLLRDDSQRLAMAAAMRRLATPSAAQTVAAVIRAMAVPIRAFAAAA